MHWQHVYGPVPSRRLGQSLGIDTIPFKTCNWNCVYCQLGRTHPLTTERRAYVPVEEVLDEVREALGTRAPGRIDWVTFVGSGEPTLHSGLGEMIAAVRSMTSLPIAVITNGSLLGREDVQSELLGADAVLPSIDAGTDVLYRKVNRAAPELDFDAFVDGIVAFRKRYEGRLWTEVMLVGGLNDTMEALRDLAVVLRRIAPDEIHLSVPIRPPAEPSVRPPDEDGLLRAVAVLGDVCRVLHPIAGTFDLTGFDDVADAIVAVIQRHPMRDAELVMALRPWEAAEIRAALRALRTDGRAQTVERYGQRFWASADARYTG